MYTICGYYTVVILILGIVLTILKDGESKTNYTGGYKLLSILFNLPTLYFVFATLLK